MFSSGASFVLYAVVPNLIW